MHQKFSFDVPAPRVAGLNYQQRTINTRSTAEAHRKNAQIASSQIVQSVKNCLFS
nr:MAG TPA: hypothetical protein [Caudoviricetes sp.]